jgi:hypothetical protein
LRAALVASCLRGAFPPVDLRAVCLVRAIVDVVDLQMQICEQTKGVGRPAQDVIRSAL